MTPLSPAQLKEFLDAKVAEYNTPEFVATDPVQIARMFTKKEDQEIGGFFASLISWGRRDMIIRWSQGLMERMGMQPHEFIVNGSEKDWQRAASVVYRTFSTADCLGFFHSLRLLYTQQGGLHGAFLKGYQPEQSIKDGMASLRNSLLAGLPDPRSCRHIGSWEKNSSMKRICMFLRWMVRRDNCGVDLGIWTDVNPSGLYIPVDVHVGETARALGIVTRSKEDWQTVEKLTEYLRTLDAEDPCKYDFALFGLGVNEKFGKPVLE